MNRSCFPVFVLLCVASAGVRSFAGDDGLVAQWKFEGDLIDGSGRGNDVLAESPEFGGGKVGQGLRCRNRPAVVPDGPDLRLNPGFRIDCWVYLDAVGESWQPIMIKEGEYQLRIDPRSEGGRFSFFVYLTGWEPRAESSTVAETGVWYHLIAGWDGAEAWIAVNGTETRSPRTGAPVHTDAPLKIGDFSGVVDEVRIENPRAVDDSVARWLFEGDLRDASGNGHDLVGKAATFVSVRGGQAVRSGAESLLVSSTPDLQLAPGLRIDVSVYFEEIPTEPLAIVFKGDEYQLRVNPSREGGDFGFFVYVDGWEPRAHSDQRVKTGVWYRIMARWDGETLTLDVNGERNRAAHRGIPAPTSNALRVGGPGMLIDHLRVANPRLPVLSVGSVRQEQALLRAGRPETLAWTIRNVGTGAGPCTARLVLSEGIRCLGDAKRGVGALPMGAERVVKWTVQADADTRGTAEVRLTADGCRPAIRRQLLTFFPAEGTPSVPLSRTGTKEERGTTYHIDSVSGNNDNTGTSPTAAWKDFTNINGRTLGPGEKLLIRRGSVINQELVVSAAGTSENWAEIGTYGEGPRPIIRRDWDIADRCVLVRNPDFLRIRGLVVCYAGKGLVVTYTRAGHQGLSIEDCVAHHIEGLYRPNAHGIPEWRDREGAPGDGLNGSAGIAVVGVAGRGITVRDCEMFQNSWGFFVKGIDVVLDRIYCHDNTVRNTSPHPAVVAVRRCVMKNSVLDASGWHASAGTMGIMLVDIHGMIIRNCTFRNMPDVGNHDEGGIDFEARGNGCLIEQCTFENNAGAAIEVLGLKSPQITNLEIRNSRFIKNNWAHKLGPSEIFIWGGRPDPNVCRSNGWIRGNGYVTLPGVDFFANEAPALTSWTVEKNTSYATVEELERAMPFNRPPVVAAGTDIRTDRRTVRLKGVVADDGRPSKGRLSVKWEVIEGPGGVVFSDERSPETDAVFGAPGDYLLRLVADDGELWLSDMVAIHVLPPGTSILVGWEFNGSLDKEGWTEVNPGTRLREWKHPQWPTRAYPVKYVAGGYFILAIEDSPDARLLSPDSLGIVLSGREVITIRFQNHTPAAAMRLAFITRTDTAWDTAKSKTFKVVPNDNGPRTYTVNMAGTPAWRGRLRRIRLDLATGKPLTGTCRFDYIWISRE
ncbi:MAG: hypothetical protein GXP31_11905 [Kiritimatiellaeota bacterium]|nr:hypothetical protein [Kiritimatiellota bacterium]